MKTLKGTLVYVKVDQPRDCWDKEKGQEWQCGIVLTDEDVVDEFNEIYNKQSAKKVKSAEFEEHYKCPLPEDAGKNVWVITLKKNTKLSNGEDVPFKYQPKVFQRKGGALVDITKTFLVGNGSKGEVSIDHWAGQKGNVARLKNVLVTELIEYVKPEGSGYESGDEFADDGEGKSVKVPEKAKVVNKPKSQPVDTDEDSSPF